MGTFSSSSEHYYAYSQNLLGIIIYLHGPEFKAFWKDQKDFHWSQSACDLLQLSTTAWIIHD